MLIQERVNGPDMLLKLYVTMTCSTRGSEA